MSRMQVSIYSEGPRVCITIHDGHTIDTHASLTPDKALDMADTLRNAAAMARMHAGTEQKWNRDGTEMEPFS